MGIALYGRVVFVLYECIGSYIVKGGATTDTACRGRSLHGIGVCLLVIFLALQLVFALLFVHSHNFTQAVKFRIVYIARFTYLCLGWAALDGANGGICFGIVDINIRLPRKRCFGWCIKFVCGL
jgi:hypothetical protein